jgi:hypothetical protein
VEHQADFAFAVPHRLVVETDYERRLTRLRLED